MAYQTPDTIEDTLLEIERHSLVLPAIQREFVWQPEQIYSLFDSLMQGYPFGTFLYWKINQEHNNDYQFYDFVLNYHERDAPHCPKIGKMPNRDVVAVLDGQQRLTALNIGVRGSLATKIPYRRWSSNDAFPKRHLHLDLLWSPNEDDDVGIRYRFEFLDVEEAKKSQSCWFPVFEILSLVNSGPAAIKWLEKHYKGDQEISVPYESLHRLFEVIREKPLVACYEEKSQELEKVLQIFIRTNSGGTVLSYSDLLLSIAVAQWTIDAREEIHQLVDELNRIGRGFSISKDWVLKAGLMLSDIGSVGFKVENFNKENMEIFEQKWNKIKKALFITLELVSSFGFNSSNLKADSALHPIAYYLYTIGAERNFLTNRTRVSDLKSIRHWLIASLLKPSGIWGSGLDSLLTAIREDIRKQHTTFPVNAIRDTMASRGKNLTFSDDEIDDLTEIKYEDKRSFSLLSLIFPHLDLRQQFHIDHIFPKDRFKIRNLRKCNLGEEKEDLFLELYNRLPNLQLLEGGENRQKSEMLPHKWIQSFKTDADREHYSKTHLLESLPHKLIEFDDFYEYRRNRLKKKIEQLLKDSTSITMD